MKRVSIVIPTRNRAHLLKFALKSVLNQTYQNLEIVVCDNHCEDNTEQIVNSFNDKKIVYVKTDQILSMPDNWEFALKYATGEYITFLTDDSYLLPTAIETIMEELNKHKLNIAVWKHVAYFSPDWLEIARKNILYVPKITSQSYILNSKDILKKLFNNYDDVAIIIPKSLNSICHRSIVERVINIQKKFFLPSCPDYTSAASVLLNSNRYLLIDKALYLDAVTTSSIGATSSFNSGESTKKFIGEFDKKLDEIVFWGILNSAGGIIKSLDDLRKFYLDSCPELNKINAVCAIMDRLIKLESNGVNVKNDWAIINKHLSKENLKFKLVVFKRKIISRLKWLIIRKVRSSPLLEKIEVLRNMNIIRGEKNKFNNIEEAGKFLVSLDDKK